MAEWFELIRPSFTFLWLALLIQMIAWLIQYRYNNSDTVDIAWSLSLSILGGLYIFQAVNHWQINNPTLIALCLAPVAWYLRLGLHLIARFKAEHEDGRYAYLRHYWGQGSSAAGVQFRFFLFFLFQVLLAWFFSLPALIISQQVATWVFADILAIGIIVVSFVGVTMADRQLLKFKQNPKNRGKVCQQGLWRYSRHPNYFFEWLHWCSYPFLAWHSLAFFSVGWWFVALYPLWMFLFLWKITGIPFNEQQNLRSKGLAYQQYQKSTNAFFPGKPNLSEE